MEVIVILIFVSLSVALVFLSLFIWNIRTGQYDDTLTPSFRILFEKGQVQEDNNTTLEPEADKTQVSDP